MPTISRAGRLFHAEQLLLSRTGCRLLTERADYCRLFQEVRFLLTTERADYSTPFRNYIIRYVKGDGGRRSKGDGGRRSMAPSIVPGPRFRTGGPFDLATCVSLRDVTPRDPIYHYPAPGPPFLLTWRGRVGWVPEENRRSCCSRPEASAAGARGRRQDV